MRVVLDSRRSADDTVDGVPVGRKLSNLPLRSSNASEMETTDCSTWYSLENNASVTTEPRRNGGRCTVSMTSRHIRNRVPWKGSAHLQFDQRQDIEHAIVCERAVETNIAVFPRHTCSACRLDEYKVRHVGWARQAGRHTLSGRPRTPAPRCADAWCEAVVGLRASCLSPPYSTCGILLRRLLSGPEVGER